MKIIKIKFEAENGEDLRKQMLDFLGINGNVSIQPIVTSIKSEDVLSIAGRNAAPETIENPVEVVTVPGIDVVDATKTTRKRKTKEEKEAEAANATEKVEESSEPGETVSEKKVEETSGEPEITRGMLTEVVLAKGREGKKALIMEVFSKFTQEDGETPVVGLPNLKPSDYAAFHELAKDL